MFCYSIVHSCLTVQGDMIKCPSCGIVHSNDRPVVYLYPKDFVPAS